MSQTIEDLKELALNRDDHMNGEVVAQFKEMFKGWKNKELALLLGDLSGMLYYRDPVHAVKTTTVISEHLSRHFAKATLTSMLEEIKEDEERESDN